MLCMPSQKSSMLIALNHEAKTHHGILHTRSNAKLHRASDHPVEPLLVMGNPRSGTTLLDTILGMHPEVVSGGELSIGSRLENKLEPLLDSYLGYPDCLTGTRVHDDETLSPTPTLKPSVRFQKAERFVTNKALNINAQLGFLRCVAPGLRTISLHRHPLDNCVSCFMSLIPMRGHGYVQDQELMARGLDHQTAASRPLGGGAR